MWNKVLSFFGKHLLCCNFEILAFLTCYCFWKSLKLLLCDLQGNWTSRNCLSICGKKTRPFKTKKLSAASSLEMHTHASKTENQEDRKEKPEMLQIVYGDIVQEWQTGIWYIILLFTNIYRLVVLTLCWSRAIPWMGGVCHDNILRHRRSSRALHSTRASRM